MAIEPVSSSRWIAPRSTGRLSFASVLVAGSLMLAACSGSAAGTTAPPAATESAAPTVTAVPGATTQTPATTTTEPVQTSVVATPTASSPSPTTAASATATRQPGGGGSVTFKPSTFSCSNSSTPVLITWTLTGRLSGGQLIMYEWDGSLGQGGQTPQTIENAGFEKQSNGSWSMGESTTGGDLCSSLGLKAGTHTWVVVEASSGGTPGAVIASGTFTVTP